MRHLIVLLLAVWASFCLAGIDEMLASQERPRIEEVVLLSTAEIERGVGPVGVPPSSERQVFTLLTKILERVRTQFPRHKRVFFGRDLEMLYDMHQLAVPAEEKALGFLAPISRLLARDSSTPAILSLLKKTGTDLEALGRGEEKVLWLDTGARGTIYCNLLSHIYRRLAGCDSASIRQTFSNVDAVMLQSRGTGNLKSYIDRIAQGSLGGQFFLDYIYFDELDPTLLDTYVSRDFRSRSRWLVDNIEHTVKWHGRTASVSESGEITLAYNDRFTGVVDKKAHLALMVRLAKFVLGEKPWPGDHCPSGLVVAAAPLTEPPLDN